MTRTDQKGGENMLVLGFDAGCGTCTEIARRVEQRVGDALAVRNLSDPEVTVWREAALGPDAPWAPTLFEVNGEAVRAWTGKGMALPLSRKLGLQKTWQLMQALGEMPNSGRQTIETPSVGMSRGRFLKGVGGAAVAVSVLSGAGPLTSIAQAATKSPYDVVQSTSIKGAELESLSRRIALNADMKTVAGNALSTQAKIEARKPSAGRVKLRNGTFITTIVYGADRQRILVHATYSQPVGRAATSIARAVVRNDREFVATKVSEGGRLWGRPASLPSRTTASGPAPLGECPPEIGSQGGPACAVYYTNECVQRVMNYNCAVEGGLVCLGCAGALVTAPGTGVIGGGLLITSACGLCITNAPGYCFACELYCRVRRIDYSRC